MNDIYELIFDEKRETEILDLYEKVLELNDNITIHQTITISNSDLDTYKSELRIVNIDYEN